MKKKIQAFASLFGLWIGWASHHTAFAIEPCKDLVEQNGFFCKNAQSILHIGIKSWAQLTKKVIEKHWAFGGEMAIGPVVEWHPLNGIGLQTGLLYSYNCFFTVDFSVDRKKLLDRNFFSFWRHFIKEIKALADKEEGCIAHAGLSDIQFHAISLPLFLRLYPEKSRKLVFYAGPRLILMLPGLEKQQYCPVHIDTSIIKNIFYKALKEGTDIADQRGATFKDIQELAEQGLSEICRSIFQIQPDRVQSQPLTLYNWDLIWDFGFEFRGSSGIVIGINGLGIVLGYDFVQ